MRKLIVIGIVAAMVMGLAVTASAAVDTNWFMYVRASTDAAAQTGISAGKLGVKSSGASDTLQGISPSYDGAVPEIRYIGTLSTPATTKTATDRVYQAQFKTGVGRQPEVAAMSWVFEVWANPGQTVFLSMWNDTVASSLLNADPGFEVKLFESVNGVATGEALKTWTGAANQTAVYGSSLTGYYYQDSFTTTAVAKQYILVAGPAVPEPGSIIAVLTGLVGLIGIRRRK